jgi:hypothetical protein
LGPQVANPQIPNPKLPHLRRLRKSKKVNPQICGFAELIYGQLTSGKHFLTEICCMFKTQKNADRNAPTTLPNIRHVMTPHPLFLYTSPLNFLFLAWLKDKRLELLGVKNKRFM